MSDTTLEKILEEAQNLPPDEQQRLRELLLMGTPEGPKTAEQLAAEQGTRPLSFEEMLGDFWPEDENLDEFLQTWREWRSEGEHRSLNR